MPSWLSRALGRAAEPATTPADEPELHCSFCGRSRREVAKLIAGPQVYICDGCIAISVHICDEESPSYFAALVLGAVAEWAPHTPHATVTPRLRAALALGGDVAYLRRLAAVAARFEDFATALAALDAIPPDQRTPEAKLDQVALLLRAEQFTVALAALDQLDPAALAGESLVVHQLHRALAELEVGGCTRARLAVHRKTALDLAPAVDALPDDERGAGLRAQRLGVLTLALLGLRELADAEAAARGRVARHPESPSAHALLARVLDARGRLADAAVARAKALEYAHPDGVLARKLRPAVTATGPFR